MKETRRDIRVPVRFQVRWKNVEEFAIDFAKDISKGGLFLETDRDLLPGSPVLISIELPDTTISVSIGARVVYRRSTEEAQKRGLSRGLGLQFFDMNPGTLEHLEAFIRERMENQDSIRTQRPPLRVLIIDDEALYQRQAAAAFREGVDQITFAKDGFEAISKVFQEPPDVILSDVTMPRMDGWQLLRLLRSRAETRAIPVLFLTRLDSEEERLRGYQLGVDDYLAKPFRPAELRARVERLVSRKPSANTPASLRGDLAQVSLPSVLSFLELERRTGALTIQGPPPGRLLLALGRPLRVELEGAHDPPQDTAMLLLDTQWGDFEFIAGPVPPGDAIQMSMTQLLLEHARRRDEAPLG